MILFPGRHLMGALECHQLMPLKNCTFFFQVVIMNRRNIRACGTPPNIPTDGQTTEHFFWTYLCIIFAELLLTNFLVQVHCTCTPMFLEQNAWVSLKQDARGNLVVKTPIFVSGYETQSMAIPKLGKIWISVSGHETQSNHWIFPFLPFAEGVCCERPLDKIIIPADGHMTVHFFSGHNYICISFSSNWSNTFWTYKMY